MPGVPFPCCCSGGGGNCFCDSSWPVTTVTISGVGNEIPCTVCETLAANYVFRAQGEPIPANCRWVIPLPEMWGCTYDDGYFKVEYFSGVVSPCLTIQPARMELSIHTLFGIVLEIVFPSRMRYGSDPTWYYQESVQRYDFFPGNQPCSITGLNASSPQSYTISHGDGDCTSPSYPFGPFPLDCDMSYYSITLN